MNLSHFDLSLSSLTPRKLSTTETYNRRDWLSKAAPQRVSTAAHGSLQHSYGECMTLMLRTITRTDQVTTVAFRRRWTALKHPAPSNDYCTGQDAVPAFVV
jgi:hypothetical protein